MGLFSNKQEYVNQHRVPSETEKAIRNLKKRCNDLEKKMESLTWRCNIITAEEAAERLKQIENEALPTELSKVFTAIDKALNNEQDSLILLEYTKERNGYTASDFPRYEMVRVYHIENLAEALRKYGYKVDIYGPEDDYGLRIKIYLRVNDKLESSKIDPDKKYILPMEGTVKAGLPHQTLYAFRVNDTWVTSLETEDAKAIGNMQYVYGKDILSAPDWVKAIKPIEVEE